MALVLWSQMEDSSNFHALAFRTSENFDYRKYEGVHKNKWKAKRLWANWVCMKYEGIYAGLLMGDDIQTGRSIGSNYWAALCWLSENQNKQP